METDLYLTKTIGWFSVDTQHISFQIEYCFTKWVVGLEFGHKFIAVNVLFLRAYINWS